MPYLAVIYLLGPPLLALAVIEVIDRWLIRHERKGLL